MNQYGQTSMINYMYKKMGPVHCQMAIEIDRIYLDRPLNAPVILN